MSVMHRRAKRRISDRWQTLCGAYLSRRTTDDPDKVTCKTCLKATGSQRTIDQRRLER